MKGTVVGNWRLEEEIGAGGMGAVYLAHHETLDRRAAIKVSAPELAHDPEFRERFQQEARTQSGLAHPHVVQVFDYLEQDGRYFLVSEYAEGGGLDRFLDRLDGPVEVDRATEWTLQALDALDFAHRRGIIHRDVKPSNMLLDARQRLKVTDFGIAFVVGTRRLTRTGVSLGTPHYMSPEQIRRPQEVDHRTDVYSVGLVLYELLAGSPAFDGDSDYDLQHAQVHTSPQPLRELNPEVSEELEEAVLTALAKEPDDRHAGCGAFARAIEASRGGTERPEAILPTSPEPPRVPLPTGTELDLQARLAQQQERVSKLQIWQWILVFLLILATVTILAVFALAQSRGEDAQRLSSSLALTRAELDARKTELGENAATVQEREAELTELRERLAAQERLLEAEQQLLEARAWPIVIADGFSGNQNGWDVGEHSGPYAVEKKWIDRNAYRWTGTAKEGFVGWQVSPTTPENDFYLAVEATPHSCPSCSYGLSFRINGGDRYHLKITGKVASVWLWANDDWTTLKDPTAVPALRANGPNRLEVIGQGSRFDFFLNGEHWESLIDLSLTGGRAGMAHGIDTTGDRAEIHFDNFEIRSKPST